MPVTLFELDVLKKKKKREKIIKWISTLKFITQLSKIKLLDYIFMLKLKMLKVLPSSLNVFAKITYAKADLEG